MTHTRSSAKDLRRTVKRTDRNRTLKSKMRTVMKKARTSVESGDDDAKAKIKESVRVLDKMVSKGIIHPNTAARKKSRLMKRHNNIVKGTHTSESQKKSVETKPEKTSADALSETSA